VDACGPKFQKGRVWKGKPQVSLSPFRKGALPPKERGFKKGLALS